MQLHEQTMFAQFFCIFLKAKVAWILNYMSTVYVYFYAIQFYIFLTYI